MCVSSFRVGPWHLIERALLAHNKYVHKLSDEVALPCPDNQEISLRHLM